MEMLKSYFLDNFVNMNYLRLPYLDFDYFVCYADVF